MPNPRTVRAPNPLVNHRKCQANYLRFLFAILFPRPNGNESNDAPALHRQSLRNTDGRGPRTSFLRLVLSTLVYASATLYHGDDRCKVWESEYLGVGRSIPDASRLPALPPLVYTVKLNIKILYRGSGFVEFSAQPRKLFRK